jgi:hypothetical protein
MESLFGEYKWILDLIAYLVMIASIIVKATPTLKDDNAILPVVKFVGKYIALNKYSPNGR